MESDSACALSVSVIELHDIYVDKIEEAYKEGEIDSELQVFLWEAVRGGYLEGRKKYEPSEEEKIVEGLEKVLDCHMQKVFPDYEEKVSPFADDAAAKKIAEECEADLKKRLKSETYEKKDDKSSQ